jgi:hypothetical protein
MSATTLLLINALCAFFGSTIGAFLGVYSWFKRQKIRLEEMDE